MGRLRASKLDLTTWLVLIASWGLGFQSCVDEEYLISAHAPETGHRITEKKTLSRHRLRKLGWLHCLCFVFGRKYFPFNLKNNMTFENIYSHLLHLFRSSFPSLPCAHAVSATRSLHLLGAQERGQETTTLATARMPYPRWEVLFRSVFPDWLWLNFRGHKKKRGTVLQIDDHWQS